MSGPRLLVVAGPNGSGKTTLTSRLRRLGFDFGRYINADDIALDLPWSADRSQVAQREADRLRRKSLEEGVSFSFETVMSHPSKIDDMREAKSRGYHFTFYFIAVSDPQINVDRVRHRVALGGHDVPADRIIARYHRSMSLMSEALLLADQSFVFDNSDVRTGPSLVAQSRRQGETIELVLSNLTPTPAWVSTHVIGGLEQASARDGHAISIFARP